MGASYLLVSIPNDLKQCQGFFPPLSLDAYLLLLSSARTLWRELEVTRSMIESLREHTPNTAPFRTS